MDLSFLSLFSPHLAFVIFLCRGLNTCGRLQRLALVQIGPSYTGLLTFKHNCKCRKGGGKSFLFMLELSTLQRTLNAQKSPLGCQARPICLVNCPSTSLKKPFDLLCMVISTSAVWYRSTVGLHVHKIEVFGIAVSGAAHCPVLSLPSITRRKGWESCSIPQFSCWLAASDRAQQGCELLVFLSSGSAPFRTVGMCFAPLRTARTNHHPLERVLDGQIPPHYTGRINLPPNADLALECQALYVLD